ncbi:MAG: single-stranded DNA-binding protein [Myxococcota bacterium]|jgi:single-strand DNA-binding protein|nr:single-stranded DNA-binding protein [Myxococcota bacterium]
MRGINKVLILGHVGHDPEPRLTPTGRTVCDLRVATNRPTKTEDGWQERTDWHRVRVWEKLAELSVRRLHKGSPVAIEGHLRTDTWTGADQARHARTYVQADRLHFLPDRAERPAQLTDTEESAGSAVGPLFPESEALEADTSA